MKTKEYYFTLIDEINYLAEKRWGTYCHLTSLWSPIEPFFIILKPYVIEKYRDVLSYNGNLFSKSRVIELDNYLMEVLYKKFPALKKETIIIEHYELSHDWLGTIKMLNASLKPIEKRNSYVIHPKI